MIIKNGKIDSPVSRDYIARIGLFADVHVGYSSWGDYYALNTVISNMNRKHPDFCFIIGDCIDSGYSNTQTLMKEQLTILNQCFSKLKSPLFRIKGNHDADVSSFTEFGTVTFNGIRFVCIYPKYVGTAVPEGQTAEHWGRGLLTDDDIAWIKTELEAGEGYKNVILSHYCLVDYSQDNRFIWSIGDTMTNIYNGEAVDGHRDDLIALLNAHDVDVFINGHEHKNGLVNAVVDGTSITNVQIPSTTSRYAVLTVYDDRYEFVEYDSATDEQTATLTVVM